jgi:hypothetical protein
MLESIVGDIVLGTNRITHVEGFGGPQVMYLDSKDKYRTAQLHALTKLHFRLWPKVQQLR